MCFLEDDMKKKVSRLGVVSHVGIFLSFVIFVTFIMFIYVIIKPAVGTENNQNLLNHLKNVLIENSSSELTSVSVLIDTEITDSCVRLSGFFNRAKISSDKIIVRDDDGDVLTSKISGENLFVENIGDEIFLKIYESENFPTIELEAPSCQLLDEGSDYILGLIRTEKNIFEKQIIQIIESYNHDYESLKEELNIIRNEFRLNFTYANGTDISTEKKEVSVNVFVDEFPIQYINKDAVRELGSLNVEIW